MRFGYTILYVEDVKKALAFYGQAFGFATTFLHESGDFGELNTGTTALAFSSRALMTTLKKNPQRPTAQAPCFEIAFVTDNVAETLESALHAGGRLIQPPEDMPWGQTVAYIADPDGFLVEICTPFTPPA